MADIGSYLKKILSAVYGEEVRGSIHDAISAINGEVSAVDNARKKDVEDLTQCADDLKDAVVSMISCNPISWETLSAETISLVKGSLWYIGIVSPDVLQRTTGNSSIHQSAWVSVKAGEIYRIHTYAPNSSFSGSLIYLGNAQNDGLIFNKGTYKNVEVSAIEGWGDYFVAIPNGYNYLLINSNGAEEGNIGVSKLVPGGSGNSYITRIDLSDTSTYDADTWYPVTGTCIPKGGLHKIQVCSTFDMFAEGKKPSWATNDNGYTCNMEIYAKAQEQVQTDGDTICTDYSWKHTQQKPCGYVQMPNSSTPVALLRGGGIYDIGTDYDAVWTVHTGAYLSDGDRVRPASKCTFDFERATVFANLSGKSTSADKWSTPRYFEGAAVDGSVNRHHFGVCNTVGSDSNKTCSISGISVIGGARVNVQFTNANTASNPTLNVNGAGASPIYWRGEPLPGDYIYAGAIMELQYLSSGGAGAWHVVGDPAQAQIEEMRKEIEAVNYTEVHVDISEGYFWALYDAAGHETVRKLPTEAEGNAACSTMLAVEPGEKYKISTMQVDGDYYLNSLRGVVIAVAYIFAGNEVSGDAQYDVIQYEYSPIKEYDGECEYIVTIPEGAERLMVSSFGSSNSGISIQKMRAQGSAGGAKILWSGLLKGSTTGISVEFAVPEDCFFDDGKELILAINGYCTSEESYAYELYTTGLCFGTAEDFGLDSQSLYFPYGYGQAVRTVYRGDSDRWNAVTGNSHPLNASVLVTKVPDSRNAVCTLSNSSFDFYITSVSAIIPG